MREPYISLKITEFCNYQCSYCYHPHATRSHLLDAAHLRNFISGLNDWNICLTGGEPLTHPDFLALCEKIVESNRLSFNTNLSLRNVVHQFAERIDPKKVEDIYVSVHIEEREKRNELASLIEDMLLLKQCGFPVRANFVVHPTLFEKYLELYALFSKHQLKLIPKPFKGRYQQRNYPQSYTEEQRNFFQQFRQGYSFNKRQVFNFKGLPCLAGKQLLSINAKGDIFRCPSDPNSIGNIQSPDFALATNATKCNVNRCSCFGADYIEFDQIHGQIFEGTTALIAGDYLQAIKRLAPLKQMTPDHPAIKNNLALAYFHQGYYLRAWLTLRRLVTKKNLPPIAIEIGNEWGQSE